MREAQTAEHVPPKLFFPKQLRRNCKERLLKLKAHRACNEDYKLDEEYFVASLLPLVSHTRAGGLLLAERAQHYHAGKPVVPLMRQVLNEFDERPSGLHLPPGTIAKHFASARLNRVAWKIVRGLHYSHCDVVLPESTLHCSDVALHGEALPGFAALLEDKVEHGVDADVFAYRFAQITDVEGMYFWALKLWGYLRVLVFYHDPCRATPLASVDDSSRS